MKPLTESEAIRIKSQLSKRNAKILHHLKFAIKKL